MVILRDYQEKAVQSTRKAYGEKSIAPLLVLPTGAGKTVVFSYIASEASKKGKCVLVLVHRIELLRQTSKKLTEYDVDHGLINPRFTPKPFAKVQVASVQTIVKRMLKMKFRPDLIIVDEAHHATAGTWKKILDYYNQARKEDAVLSDKSFKPLLVLGVTATPIRSDGSGLDEIFDDLIIGPQISELINKINPSTGKPYLCKPLVYAPETIEAPKTTKVDWGEGDLEMLMDDPVIYGSVVKHYKRLCGGVPAVAFCVSKKHALNVAQSFIDAGVRAAAVDGDMEDEERTRILKGLETGDIKVVTSCNLISEGTDIPAIGAAIMLRHTKSLGLFLQQAGRALRPYGDKEYAIILDHVGNVMRHGLPEWDREWTIDGVKKNKKGGPGREKAIAVTQCPSCYACHNTGPSCPQCGHKYEVKSRELEEVEGELKQVTKEAETLIRKQMRKEVGAAKTLEELLRIEKDRGYKNGWAKHVHAARNKKSTNI